MKSLFNMDNPVFQFLGRIADVFILNFLCILCCIPLITIGPSVSALYYCMLKITRDRDSSIAGMFFHSFRANLKQGILLTVIYIAAAAFLVIDIHACNELGNAAAAFIKMLLSILTFLVFVLISYSFPLLAQFEVSTRNIMKTALSLAYIHIGYTVLILIFNAIPLVLFFLFPNIFILSFPLWITLGFALIALINSKLFVKIFDKYIPENQLN